MKLHGRVILSIVLVACAATCTQAVFGDGSLNAKQHEKARSLSKRSVLEMFAFVPWIRSKFARSAPEGTNVTTEAPTTVSTVTSQPSAGIKNDFARMLTLTRQKRAPRGGHEGEHSRGAGHRSRRSLQELRSIEGLLKAKQDSLTEVLRTLNHAIFNTQPQPHRSEHAGLSIGLNSVLVPFGVAPPEQNTILILHHNASNVTGINNQTVTPNATDITPSPSPIAAGGSANPAVAIVGSAGPALTAPVVIVVQQPAANTTSQNSTDGVSSGQALNPRRPPVAAGGAPTISRPVGTSVSSVAQPPPSTTIPSAVVIVVQQPAANTTSQNSTDGVSSGQALNPRRPPAAAGGAPTTSSPVGTSVSSVAQPPPSTTIPSAGPRPQDSTINAGSAVEGSGAFEAPEQAREDNVFRFLRNDA